MAIITLTTDWNKSDHYLGAVKGKILSKDINTKIVDISHQVQPFNIMQAAFILRNCCFNFPKGTIHIVAVNAAISEKCPLLMFEKSGHFFISSDNGIAGLISSERPEDVYKIKGSENVTNFLSLDLFIDTAFNLIGENTREEFCEPFGKYQSQIPYRPVIDKRLINGSVIYIDSYSNAITNVSSETFEKVGKGMPFEIFVQSNHYKIEKINKTYADSVSGELLALFNSAGLLEIAINYGNAAELLNLSINSAIRIKFSEKKPANELTLTGG